MGVEVVAVWLGVAGDLVDLVVVMRFFVKTGLPALVEVASADRQDVSETGVDWSVTLTPIDARASESGLSRDVVVVAVVVVAAAVADAGED